MPANFHTHTTFCDGLNPPEDYITMAIKKGMPAIGFSTHVPIHIANQWSMPAAKLQDYFTEMRRLKAKYAQRIEIYVGFEMDYLITADKNSIYEYIKQADYTIGSVHYLYSAQHKKYYTVDSSATDVALTYQELAHNDGKFMVSSYYHELLRILHKFKPNIIGHLDVIKKQNLQNRYFDESESWYIDLVDQVLETIVANQMMVEVNTGGKARGYITDNYPSTWILKKCLAQKIPIILSSDAHRPEDLDAFFDETTNHLKSLGFTHQKTLCAGKWIDVGI